MTIKTVGELVHALAQFNPSLPIRIWNDGDLYDVSMVDDTIEGEIQINTEIE